MAVMPAVAVIWSRISAVAIPVAVIAIAMIIRRRATMIPSATIVVMRPVVRRRSAMVPVAAIARRRATIVGRGSTAITIPVAASMIPIAMILPPAIAPLVAPAKAVTTIEIISESRTKTSYAGPVGTAPAPLITMPVASHPEIIPAVRISIIHRSTIPLAAEEHRAIRDWVVPNPSGQPLLSQ